MIEMNSILCDKTGCYKVSTTLIYFNRKGRKVRSFVCDEHKINPPKLAQMNLFSPNIKE